MQNKPGFLALLMKSWWLRHLLFWFFVWNYYALGLGMTGSSFTLENLSAAYGRSIKFLPGYILVTYPLMYWLIPSYLLRRKYVLFVGMFILLIILVAVPYANILKLQVNRAADYIGFDFKRGGRNILPFIHVSGIAVAVKLIKKAYYEERVTLKANQQKTEAELELLKAQIHPHFLFNTLNNLFAHTLRNSADASNIVLKLSDLLRFMIYDSRESFIPLSDELQLLRNYIDLEKLRYGKELECTLTVAGEPEKYWIRPLLLIPLLENCFKHGMSKQTGRKWIDMQVTINQQGLHLDLSNSCSTEADQLPGERKVGGIGLENVRRRLQLLYPGAHELSVARGDGVFSVILHVPLETEIKVHTPGEFRESQQLITA